ncbi:MAG: hypothetical protein ABEH40_00010 [Haloferacaceae archaeon]
MNLEELRDARRTERERDGLQSLPDTFYRDVAAYLSDLKAERERAAEAAADPFADPEVRRLTEEIETAEDVVESIYERRVGKVVDRASFAAADMRHDTEGLTAEERDLFEDLVGRIERNRERVLAALDPEDDADAGTGTGTGSDGERTDEGGIGGGPDPEAGTGPAADATGTGGGPPTAREADAEASGGPTGDAGGTEEAPDPSDLLVEAMGGSDAADADGSGGPTGAAAEGPGTTDGGIPAGSDPDPDTGTGTGPGAADGDRPRTGSAEAAAAPAAGSDPSGGDAGTGGSVPDRDGERDRKTVYVTRDVGEIFGVDERTYRLAAEDVVDLPADNARALVERNAAEPLE